MQQQISGGRASIGNAFCMHARPNFGSLLALGFTYLDEAVVEGHADEAGAEAGVDVDGVPDGLPDDFLGVRARPLVEVEPQPCPRRSRRWRSLGWWA